MTSKKTPSILHKYENKGRDLRNCDELLRNTKVLKCKYHNCSFNEYVPTFECEYIKKKKHAKLNELTQMKKQKNFKKNENKIKRKFKKKNQIQNKKPLITKTELLDFVLFSFGRKYKPDFLKTFFTGLSSYLFSTT